MAISLVELEPGVGLSAAILLVRITLLLAGALWIARVLRGAGPDARHRFWHGALVAALLLPLLAWALPSLPLPGVVVRAEVPLNGASGSVVQMPEAAPGIATGIATGLATGRATGLAPDPAADVASVQAAAEYAPARSRWPGAGSLLLWLWGLGVAGSLMAVAAGLARASGLISEARTVTGRDWEEQIRELMRRVGLPADRVVRVALSSRVRFPMAGGIVRPVLLLPESAEGWSHDRREAVLLHELVHVQRHDPVRLLLARLVVALYWLHPLAWTVARAAAEAREEACDARVLELGTRPSTYARHLLELAESTPCTRRRPSIMELPGLAGFHHPDLEKRLMAILTPVSSPSFTRRRRAACLVGGLAWVGVLAACAPSVMPGAPVPPPPDAMDSDAPPPVGVAPEVPAPPAPPAVEPAPSAPRPAPAPTARPAPSSAPRAAPAPPRPGPSPAPPLPSVAPAPPTPGPAARSLREAEIGRLEAELDRLEALEPRMRDELARLADVQPRLEAAAQRLEAEGHRLTETVRRMETELARGSLEGPVLAERLATIEALRARSQELVSGREQAEIEQALAEHMSTLPARMEELELRLAEQRRSMQERIEEIRRELSRDRDGGGEPREG